MTNEAISAILEHLCNEARNSMHATFGVMEILVDVVSDPRQRASAAVGRASADRLLRSLDDVRHLLSKAAPPPANREEFDFALCAGEIIEVLNVASGKRRRHMLLDVPSQPLLLTQDRKLVEEVISRVLDTAFKLSPVNDVHVRLSPRRGEQGVWLAISTREPDLAVRLSKWLNTDADHAVLQELLDLPSEIAVMVAGKQLRALGGSAELESDAAGHSVVALDLPSQAESAGAVALVTMGVDAQPNALNVLVAEDSDDSFALTELMLPQENIWRARDGIEAMRVLQKQRFDVVLVDVHMPGMDGYALIRGMRDWETQTGNARTPMVIVSSDDLETQRRSAARSGCSGFLRKPLRRNDLTGLLDRLREVRTLVA